MCTTVWTGWGEGAVISTWKVRKVPARPASLGQAGFTPGNHGGRPQHLNQASWGHLVSWEGAELVSGQRK